MKVAYLSNAFPSSGVGYYAHSLLQALHVAVADIELVEYLLDGQAARLEKNGQTIESLHPWPSVLNAKTINWLRLGRIVQRELGNQPVNDVYHATNQTLSFLVRPGQRWVVTVHDIIELLEPQARNSSLVARHLYRGITHAQHIIAVSDYTAERLREYYGSTLPPITVIPNGVSADFKPVEHFKSSPAYQQLRHDLKLPTEGPIILYVGSDHPRKNLPVVLRVFAKIKVTYPDAILLKVGAAGTNAGRTHTTHMIGQLKLESSIRILEKVTQTRLAEIYNAADLLLFPSKFEGFGLPVLQAMACGLPVVASNTTSIPEVTGQAALLRSPEDIDGLTSDSLRILADQSLRQQLREAGLAQALNFTWQNVADKTLSVYTQCI